MVICPKLLKMLCGIGLWLPFFSWAEPAAKSSPVQYKKCAEAIHALGYGVQNFERLSKLAMDSLRATFALYGLDAEAEVKRHENFRIHICGKQDQCNIGASQTPSAVFLPTRYKSDYRREVSDLGVWNHEFSHYAFDSYFRKLFPELALYQDKIERVPFLLEGTDGEEGVLIGKLLKELNLEFAREDKNFIALLRAEIAKIKTSTSRNRFFAILHLAAQEALNIEKSSHNVRLSSLSHGEAIEGFHRDSGIGEVASDLSMALLRGDLGLRISQLKPVITTNPKRIKIFRDKVGNNDAGINLYDELMAKQNFRTFTDQTPIDPKILESLQAENDAHHKCYNTRKALGRLMLSGVTKEVVFRRFLKAVELITTDFRNGKRFTDAEVDSALVNYLNIVIP